MNILKATKRTTASSGQINKLRLDGFIPAVLYGGKQNNLNKLKRSKKIEIISIAPMISEAMKRISNSTSVSSLFK